MAPVTASGPQVDASTGGPGVASALRRRIRVALVLWSIAALALGALVRGPAPAAGAQTVVVTEFSAGISPESGTWEIASGPDGNLWFTEQSGNRIGRITPSGVVTPPGVATLFTAGITGNPQGIAVGADGNLWFAESSGGWPGSTRAIGRITPQGAITEFTVGLTPGNEPAAITAGPDGNLWFTEAGGFFGPPPRIGRITPGGVITEVAAPTGVGDSPYGIFSGPDGNLWFTGAGSHVSNSVGRITPTGVTTAFTAGISHTPAGITAGPDGNLWFTQPAGGVGRITPQGVVTEFSSGLTTGGSPEGITAGPDGNLWFTEAGGFYGPSPRIGRITPAGVITEFTAGITSSSRLGGITAGPDGNLWFTEQYGRIGRVTPQGVVTEFSAGLAMVGPIAITAGPDGNLWFTFSMGSTTGGIGRITPPGPGALTPPGPGAAAVTPQLPSMVAPTAIPTPVKPLTLKIAGPKTVKRGKRATFVYRITNTTKASIRGVVVTNTLPKGLGIDAISRRENLKVKRALRFTGGARKIIFKLGTIGKGKTVVLRVNAKVAAKAAKGKTTNTVVFWGAGVKAARVTSKVTVK